jgi:hypothetical protein
MPNRHHLVASCLFLALVGGRSSQAQVPHTQFPQFNQTGTITKLAPGAVEIRNEHNETIVMSLTPQRGHHSAGPVQIVVHAGLSPAGLKAGMSVKFQAVLGDDGTVDEELTKLLASLQKSRRKFAPEPAAGPDLPQGTMLVVGNVVSCEDRKLKVAVKNGEVTATVAEYAEIKVEGVDPQVVRPGDKIYARGFSRAPSGQSPRYFAQFVSVELAEPLDQRLAPKK